MPHERGGAQRRRSVTGASLVPRRVDDDVNSARITLVVLEGYTVAAAAPLLQLSPEAAKARLHRAKHRLKKELQTPQGNAPLHPVEEGRS